MLYTVPPRMQLFIMIALMLIVILLVACTVEGGAPGREICAGCTATP